MCAIKFGLGIQHTERFTGRFLRHVLRKEGLGNPILKGQIEDKRNREKQLIYLVRLIKRMSEQSLVEIKGRQ